MIEAKTLAETPLGVKMLFFFAVIARFVSRDVTL